MNSNWDFSSTFHANFLTTLANRKRYFFLLSVVRAHWMERYKICITMYSSSFYIHVLWGEKYASSVSIRCIVYVNRQFTNYDKYEILLSCGSKLQCSRIYCLLCYANYGKIMIRLGGDGIPTFLVLIVLSIVFKCDVNLLMKVSCCVVR